MEMKEDDELDIYNKTLLSFCDKDNTYSKWMNSPFILGDNRVYATDGKILGYIETVFIRDQYPTLDGTLESSIKDVIPKTLNKNIKYPLKNLIDKLKEIELVDDFDIEEEEVECAECNGEGSVEWEYNDYQKFDTCPKCEGRCINYVEKKEPNGKKIYKTEKSVQIYNSMFNPNYIQKLINVAESLKENKIRLLYQQEENSASLFRIKELIIVLMPVRKKKLN